LIIVNIYFLLLYFKKIDLYVGHNSAEADGLVDAAESGLAASSRWAYGYFQTHWYGWHKQHAYDFAKLEQL